MKLLPKKSLGQHWLHDVQALSDIADAADIHRDETVLEVGPGLGTLTRVLAKRAGQVVAIELDEALVQKLQADSLPKNVQVVQGSILEFDLTNLPVGYKLVANIPYYLTSNLIRNLSESTNPPETAVILVQKEVAQRVAVKPGDMSILSVTAQFFWEVSLGSEVPAKLFTPPPKVDSQVLIMKRRREPLFTDVDSKKFFQVVKAGFSAKRKTLLNSLSGGLRLGKGEVEEALKIANLSPALRAQNLSLPQWHDLFKALNEK